MNPLIKHTTETSEFTGKRVLVTGGTKGAGRAIAERFQRGGATVIITARSAPEARTNQHFIQADYLESLRSMLIQALAVR